MLDRRWLSCFVLPVVLGVCCVSSAVAKAIPSTTVLSLTSGTSAVTTVAAGSPLTLTATVQASGVPVTPGQVNFCDTTAPLCTGMALLGTAQLTSAGVASLTTFPALFGHNYRAVFLGTHAVAGSASAMTALIVTGATATTTRLTSAGTPGNYTLTAKVTASAPVRFPQDAVSFTDLTSGRSLGTAGFSLTMTADAVKLQANPTLGSTTDGVVADFNGDGKLDIATLNAEFCAPPGAVPQILIQLGNGDGSFAVQAPIALSTACPNLAVGDFNNDGIADLAISNGPLLIGRGDGTFTTTSLPAIQGAMTVSDFNGDGNADIVSVAGTLLLGHGDGTFAVSSVPSIVALASSMNNPQTAVAADLNGDGNQDLALYAAGSPSNPSVVILLSNADGTFQAPITINLGPQFFSNYSFRNMVAADFNGDGKLDLAVSGGNASGNSAVNAYKALLGDGTGNLTPLAGIATFSFNPWFSATSSIVAADFDEDGRMDLAVLTDEADLNIAYGAGDGTFNRTSGFGTGVGDSPDVLNLLTGDFNGDGFPDLVAVNSDAGNVNSGRAKSYVDLFSLQQTGTAVLSGVLLPGGGSHSVQASYVDLTTFGPSTSNTVVLTAQPVPTTLAVTASAASSTYGQQVVLIAILSPNAVNGASTSGEVVTFLSGTTSLGTGKLTTGVATLNVTALPVGADSVTAVYSGDTNFAASTSAAITQTVSVVAPTVTLLASANPVLAQNAVSFTAAVASSVGTPSGMVTFTDTTAGTVLGSAALANGVSTLTTSSLAVGMHTISAQYSGDAVFGKAGASLVETVENFALGSSAGTTSQTVSTGGTATYSLSAAPVGGTTFPAAVSFAVTGLPAGAMAVFSPQVIAAGSVGVPVTLTVKVAAQSAGLRVPEVGRSFVPAIAAGILMLPLAWGRRRLVTGARGWILVLLLSAASFFVAGCSGGGAPAPTATVTQPQTYALVVTASSGGLSNATNLALIVQ